MINSLKHWITEQLYSLGYHLSVAPPLADSTSSYLRVLLDRYNIDTVIDVGAHTGQYAKNLRSMDYNGYIYSFEPTPSSYNKLKELAYDDDLWVLFNVALGSEYEERKLNIASKSDMSSFQAPTAEAKHLLGDRIQSQSSIYVDVKRLDDIFENKINLDDKSNIHLKLDVEGFERNVLKGATCTLDKCRSIQVEVAFRPMYEGQMHIREAVDILEKYGYLIGGVFPVTYNRDLLITAADLIMIHPDN